MPLPQVCTGKQKTRARKWAVFALPAVALLTLGCASVQPAEPTPDWQPTREALQKERDELRAKAAAREEQRRIAMEAVLGPDSQQADDGGAGEDPAAGESQDKSQVLTPTQIFKLLDQGKITQQEAKRLLETYQEVSRREGGVELEEERPQ